MLLKNIFVSKIISILLIIFILSNLFVFLLQNTTKATYDSKFKNYPGYEELLKKLQAAHPNWEFELYDTGLNWSEAIVAESTGRHGINVVPKTRASAWKCSCGKIVESSWTCASTAAVAYYMDPRNSLNDDYIFQFEQLTYDAEIQTKQGVETILSDCAYMQGKITYYDTKGKKQTINKTYIDVIMEAAKTYNVSPYHLASRIRQEQGTTKNGSVMITGTYKGHEGYYNYYNIGAYGSDVIANGLTWAKNKGWTDPEKAIKGGAQLIAHDYISAGQDTLYFEKFDVVANGGYYAWQYMTNVSASKSEAEKIREAYRGMGMLSQTSKMKFKIPVYKNMPEERAPMPGSEQLVTQDVQINSNKVAVKDGKGENYKTIATLNKGTNILRIEIDNAKDAKGKYWDKVVLTNGTKGYISREYLTQLSKVQTNCNEQYIVSTYYTNLRNGPGTIGTTAVRVLSPGQIITVVEKNKYNKLDGENWYRVKLSDGTYGYVAANYIIPYDPKTTNVEQVKVVCTDGINIRKEPTTSSTVLKTVAKGTILTRTEKNVKSTDTKYIWDKVTTSSGTVGYVVRQDPNTKEEWISSLSSSSGGNTGTTLPPTTIQGSGFKTSGTNIVCEPNMTVENIKKVAKDAVFKSGNEAKTTGNVGTGWTITSGGKTYTVIVLGDINGDGKVNTGDTLAMSQHIEAFKKVTNTNYLKAADVNGDGKVNTGDSLALRQHVENFKTIQF